nr:ribonuclease H-like domain-containing protein [Tanacetum cinerariifolium]
MLNSFPLLAMQILLPEYFATASEEVRVSYLVQDSLSYKRSPQVIEFGDSYEAPLEESGTGSASESSAKKKGRTVAITTEDMQKRRNDVKVRTTLLLALPNEHQLRFSKYKIAHELWGAILKTFGGNEATKKTKKNQLKQQYGNFKTEGSETLEQTFNRLQAIIKYEDINQIDEDDIEEMDIKWNMALLSIRADRF